jgi:Xaa-Pro aminopeptidase
MDVHDTNTIGPHRTLEPGVVMAVEPGLYIPDHPQFGPFAGIGVRIEDDVLISHSGAQVRRERLAVQQQQCRVPLGKSRASAPAAALGCVLGPKTWAGQLVVLCCAVQS